MPSTETPASGSPANRLLAALPPDELARFQPHLEVIPLVVKEVLLEAGAPIPHVYFPTSGVISFLSPRVGKNIGVEVGLVGREGLAGLAVFLGMETTPLRCIVQVPGSSLRMRSEDFRACARRDGVLHGRLLRYTHAFLAQVSLVLACNSLHSVEKRLCRWLLMMQHWTGVDEFWLTREFLAAMLGVRRAGVSEATQKLQCAGLIHASRGQVRVIDRARLEASSCNCHRLVQAELDRLLSEG